ncbi:MAG: peptidylprolyl isomerase [Flavobacteriales bacterium]|nr:peptidylprolyl isomerase [Flavobacteriales bacterium]
MKNILIATFFLSAVAGKAQTQVDFYTNYGEFRIDLYDSLVPITTTNFIDLVNQQFYDGVTFHRVIDNFMIQGGDGSPTPPIIQDEFDSSLSNIQATISMANSGPNTGTCQFFINLVNNTYLDFDKAPLTSKHPVFGITTGGFDIIQTIGAVATNSSDAPIDPVVMDSVRVVGPPLSVGELQKGEPVVEVYPNPYNGTTNIRFELKQNEVVSLVAYNVQGQLIETLIDNELAKGKHNIDWDGANAQYGNLAKGLYYLTLTTPSTTETISVVKL